LTRGRRNVIVLLFAEVSLSKVSTYGDDPVGTRHLEFEVGVVGDGHEFGIAWPTQDGVIGTLEVCNLEGNRFLVEICSTFKRYGQVDLSKGNGLEPRYDSMEWSTGQPYHRS
jgi:hypothetical protein